jgi:hypothetical protein
MGEIPSVDDMRGEERIKEGVEVEVVESGGAMMAWPSSPSFPLSCPVLVRDSRVVHGFVVRNFNQTPKSSLVTGFTRRVCLSDQEKGLRGPFKSN